MTNGFHAYRMPRFIDAWAAEFIQPTGTSQIDFSHPTGEPALIGPHSVAWRVFRSPVAMFVGGVAAVLLELGEPRVRAGVWDHSDFRADPVGRLKRTGLAAMVTVYGARSVAEKMIAGIRRAHDAVSGTSEAGPYRANDPELLAWVQITASFGFLNAFSRYVSPLSRPERDAFYREGVAAGRLYGAEPLPMTESEVEALLERTRPSLNRSPAVEEFLRLMRTAPILPLGLRSLQRLLVAAAIDLVPAAERAQIGLPAKPLSRVGGSTVRLVARLADRLRLDRSPAAQASVRLGLPPDYLLRAR